MKIFSFKKCKNRKCFIFYDECCSRSLPFWIQNESYQRNDEGQVNNRQTKKEKAHKCLKPKLRNYQQNRVKRFVINQENLNYQSSVWRKIAIRYRTL
ncbi:hypothetical protein Anas_01561 [Armadillidium nasatum]|uniref:Uncharacterized protein n=1 Tax=Armadillidium nasatum TaxID=96803 RepID=A0A5N5SWJ5_9CRUS|nr:hypothetical protein Anas_01561 [Armadillidium nasatum]